MPQSINLIFTFDIDKIQHIMKLYLHNYVAQRYIIYITYKKKNSI